MCAHHSNCGQPHVQSEVHVAGLAPDALLRVRLVCAWVTMTVYACATAMPAACSGFLPTSWAH